MCAPPKASIVRYRQSLLTVNTDAAQRLGLDRAHHGSCRTYARGLLSGQRFENRRRLDCSRRTHLPTLDYAAEDWGSLEESHFDSFLLSLFAGIALVLSSVGIYGVLSHVFAQRTREIGVRMALGATRGQIARHVLGCGLRVIAIGIAVGITSSLVGAHLVSSLLYGIRSTDATTFAAASCVLATVALTASYIPARRAMRVDPMVALRYE